MDRESESTQGSARRRDGMADRAAGSRGPAGQTLGPASSEEPVLVPVAVGELADKLTILEIKAERIRDVQKLRNVRSELKQLRAVWDRRGDRPAAVEALIRDLKQTNERLWDIENDIRDCERQHDFGRQFVELARAIYRTNDLRTEIKREINLLLGSPIIEEKSYRAYQCQTVGSRDTADGVTAPRGAK